MFKDHGRNLEAYLSNPPAGSAFHTLKPQQREAVYNVSASVNAGYYRGVLQAPTGFGKTRDGIVLCQAIGGKSLWVTPRVSLIEQTQTEFAKLAPDLPTSTYFGENKDLSAPVNITTYDSYRNGLLRGHIQPGEYPLVIYDEGHHLLGEKTRQGVERFPTSIQIALTATPAYGVNHHLYSLLPEPMYSMSIREAVEQDLGCSFSVFLVMTDVDLKAVRVKGRGFDRDYDQKELEKAVNISRRNRAAVEIFTGNFRDKYAINFCVGVEHSEAVAQAFREAGVSSEAVHYKQPKSVQRAILKAFQNREFQVLSNDRMCVEGSDYPHVSVVNNLRPSLSPVDVEQRGGRGLRFDPNDPYKYTYIFDYIDQISGTGKTPLSFATVAEAAQVLNSFYSSDAERAEPANKRIYLEAEGFQVKTRAKEVMWAANTDYTELTPFDTREWRTLVRISAESGLPHDLLQRLAYNHRVQIEDYAHRASFRAPHGGVIDHYDAAGTYVLVKDVLGSFGWQIDMSTIPEADDENFPYVKKGDSPYDTGYTRQHQDHLWQIRQSVGRASEGMVQGYVRDLLTHINETRAYGDF